MSAAGKRMRECRMMPDRRLGFILVLVLVLTAPVLLAQSGGGYDLHWNKPAAGGGTMNGANGYTLSGTIAQPDANASGAMNGAGSYALSGGFWTGAHGTSDVVFRNSFETAP